MSDSIIQINNVNKWFGDFQVLKDINLEVKPKEKIVVCGPSGSGKSTLIRCINRLEEHQEGDIIVDGTALSESQVQYLYSKRNVVNHPTLKNEIYRSISNRYIRTTQPSYAWEFRNNTAGEIVKDSVSNVYSTPYDAISTAGGMEFNGTSSYVELGNISIGGAAYSIELYCKINNPMEYGERFFEFRNDDRPHILIRTMKSTNLTETL